jgi:type II secretory pathway pseudopilin PulG
MKSVASDFPARRALRGRRGVALMELMITALILSLVTAVILGLVTMATRIANRRTQEGAMGSSARTSLDEVLQELRAANQILLSRTLGGKTYTSAGSDIVFQAPGYDPLSAQGILPGIYDVVAFRYDPAAQVLTETAFPGAGSKRPQRTLFVIARQVRSVRYVYRVRDHFIADGNNPAPARFELNAPPEEAPTAYVDGRRVGARMESARRAVLDDAPPDGADVQFLYTVRPAADSLPHVSGVDVELTLSEEGGRALSRTLTLAGSARLRNQRT